MGEKLHPPEGGDVRAEATENEDKSVPAIFYRTEASGEPVRESSEDRERTGEDIKTVEFGWPLAMPVCRPLGEGIYEVRTSLGQNRIARVLFYIDKKSRMVLLRAYSSRKRRKRRNR